MLADPIDDWLNPELTVSPAQRMSLLTMAEALEAQHPGAIGLGVTRIDEAGRLTSAF